MDYSKNISIFENYFSKEPALSCSVEDFCLNIVSGDYMEEVEAIRKETDKQARDKIKATLPAATVSGTFSERKRSGLIGHSSFISIDIDAKDNPNVDNWEHERDKLAHIKNVFFSALSVSGQGVFLVIPIENPAKHEAHFDVLKMDFAKIGHVIDSHCRDVCRLRGISYDPEAKVNYDAIPYKRIYVPKKRYIKPYKRHTDDLGTLLDKILSSGLDLTNGYENWFEIGRALVNEYGESGRAYFHRLSQGYHKYSPQECDKQYNACLRSPGRATKGTIFHLAKEHGIMMK